MRDVSELNLKLLKRAPFIATVALHADVLVQEHPGVDVAATDGRHIYLNPGRFLTRPPDHKFIYAHEVLHCALSHPQRRGNRNPVVWNVAADIVVNGMLVDTGFEMLDDLSRLSTEEVYEQLLTKAPERRLRGRCDLLEAEEDGAEITRGYWQNVLRRAATLARMTQAGLRPLGRDLEFVLGKPQVNWRDALTRYLVGTQDDYGAFDTRIIYRGLYVETLESTGLTVAVHISTPAAV